MTKFLDIDSVSGNPETSLCSVIQKPPSLEGFVGWETSTGYGCRWHSFE